MRGRYPKLAASIRAGEAVDMPERDDLPLQPTFAADYAAAVAAILASASAQPVSTTWQARRSPGGNGWSRLPWRPAHPCACATFPRSVWVPKATCFGTTYAVAFDAGDGLLADHFVDAARRRHGRARRLARRHRRERGTGPPMTNVMFANIPLLRTCIGGLCPSLTFLQLGSYLQSRGHSASILDLAVEQAGCGATLDDAIARITDRVVAATPAVLGPRARSRPTAASPATWRARCGGAGPT